MKKKLIITAVVCFVIGIAAGALTYFLVSRNNGGSTIGTEKTTISGTAEEKVNITPTFSELTEGYKLFDYIAADPDRYKKSAVDSCGMSSSKAESLVSEPEEWLANYLFIDIENPSDKEIVIEGVKVEDNGKNGVYIDTDLGATNIAEPACTSEICLNVFTDSNEPSYDEIFEMIKEMDIKVVYAVASDNLADEIPEDQYCEAQVLVK